MSKNVGYNIQRNYTTTRIEVIRRPEEPLSGPPILKEKVWWAMKK